MIQTQPNLTRRITATIVDYGIYMAFWTFYVFQFGSPDDDGGYSVSGWPAFILFLTWFFYFPFIESIKGQTLGHMVTQQRVVTLKGNSITFGQSLRRRILDGLEIFGTFGILAIISVKNSERNQRVGDVWAKTIVIGGETTYCQECREKLTLTPEETIHGNFKCPECGKDNLS